MDEPRDRYNLDFRELHQIIRPGDVRSSDRIIARIRKRDTSDSYETLRVWKLSPLGIELDDPEEASKYAKGDPVDLEITIDGERSNYEGLVVDVVQQNELIRLLGIRLGVQKHEGQSSHERRKAPRWICSNEFYPSAMCTSPGVVNDFTRFQIRDISKDGMQLVCSLRNKYLLPGRRLQLAANFPMVGEFVVPVQIARVSLTASRGKDELSVGVEFLQLNDHIRKTLAQYLIQFSSVETLEDLRVAGFTPASISKAVDFYFLKSEADYKKVLNLRLAAHQYDRNILETVEATPEDLADIEDSRSRIIVGMYRNRVVATGRIRYSDMNSPLEHEKYVDWPTSLPRREQIMEISRVCTDPEFRRGDLLTGLFQFIGATCIQTHKPYVLIGSWPEMREFYAKIGFRDTGLAHTEPLWKSKQHLMIGHSVDTMLGRDVGPVYWNLVWRVAAEHTMRNGLIQPAGLDILRLRIYRLLGPISQWILNHRRKLRARK